MMTRKEFEEKRLDFFRRNPTAYVMIRPNYETIQEKEIARETKRRWFTYMEDMGLRKIVYAWKNMLKHNLSLQMPCLEPERFDPSYVPRERVEQTDFDRERMKQRFADLIKELKAATFVCTPHTCPRKYGQECPREDRRWCRSSDDIVERGFLRS